MPQNAARLATVWGKKFKDFSRTVKYLFQTYSREVLPHDFKSIQCFWHHVKIVQSVQLALLTAVRQTAADGLVERYVVNHCTLLRDRAHAVNITYQRVVTLVVTTVPTTCQARDVARLAWQPLVSPSDLYSS